MGITTSQLMEGRITEEAVKEIESNSFFGNTVTDSMKSNKRKSIEELRIEKQQMKIRMQAES